MDVVQYPNLFLLRNSKLFFVLIVAKKLNSSQKEQNAFNTSDTGSSSESPNNSCYSHGNIAKSLFTIEDTLESAKKSTAVTLADSSA